MDKNEIILKAEEYVSKTMTENLNKLYSYHNYEHVKDIVKGVKTIGEKEKVTEDEMEILVLAALFHDIGYTVCSDGHEEKSADEAKRFLSGNNYPFGNIEKITACIRATKMPQNPSSLLEKIICDADLLHIAKKNFFEKMNLLRFEIEHSSNKNISDSAWYEGTIRFFTAHEFHTNYVKENYLKKKNDNLIELQKKLRKSKKQEEDENVKRTLQLDKIAIQKDKKEKPERGIETMFRIIFSNHMRLSSMADNKSHIMISVNTIMISIVVSFLVRNLPTHNYLVVPTLILLTTSLLSMVFAILVTKPSITRGEFSLKDIENKKANLLFFGNFYKMEFDNFEKGIHAMMDDKNYLYGSMIKDFYYLGKVLGHKYKFINICYYIFMFGMIISIAAFAFAIITTPNAELPILKK